jgi:hypothetical protein
MTNTTNTTAPAAPQGRTYEVTLPNGEVKTRRTESMLYTHAVVTGSKVVRWSTTEANARKAAKAGEQVVPVTLRAPKPRKAAKAVLPTAAEVAAAVAESAATGAPAPVVRTASTVSKDGEMVCGGACGRTLPVTKFPTSKNKDGEVVRLGRCRECRDAAAAARKAAKA